jgi:CRISPR-associated protein Csy2
VGITTPARRCRHTSQTGASGGICHHYEEQVTDSYIKAFRLTRNPVDRDGGTAAIVEEGRIHLDVTLLFQVAQSVAQAPAPR